jgi:hypothetical protein
MMADRPGARGTAVTARPAVVVVALLLGLLASTPGSGAPETLSYRYRGQLADELTYRFIRSDSLLNPRNRILELRGFSNRIVGDLDLRVSVPDLVDAVLRDRAFYLTGDGSVDGFHNTVEEAYLRFRFPRALAEIGKRSLPEGVGYSFNPVDFLRVPSDLPGTDPDPAQFREHRPGQYLVRILTDLGPLTVSGLYAPKLHDVDSPHINEVDQFLFKVYSLVRGHDVSLYLYRGNRWKGGASWATVIGRALELHAEASLQRGSDAKVPVAAGILGDAPFHFVRADGHDLIARALVGGQYTFGNGINVIAEYFHNGQGYSPAEFRRYFGFLDTAALDGTPGGASALGEATRNLDSVQGRHFVFARLGDILLPMKLRLVAFGVLNLEDGSHLVSSEMSRAWGDLRVTLGYDGFLGSRRSQFGSLPVAHQLRFFARYYF